MGFNNITFMPDFIQIRPAAGLNHAGGRTQTHMHSFRAHRTKKA
jgi:hypothetical protein